MAVRGDQLGRGSVIGGYRIDELIGRGGMGLVYRATNVALNRIYALKVLAPGLAEDEQSFVASGPPQPRITPGGMLYSRP